MNDEELTILRVPRSASVQRRREPSRSQESALGGSGLVGSWHGARAESPQFRHMVAGHPPHGEIVTPGRSLNTGCRQRGHRRLSEATPNTRNAQATPIQKAEWISTAATAKLTPAMSQRTNNRRSRVQTLSCDHRLMHDPIKQQCPARVGLSASAFELLRRRPNQPALDARVRSSRSHRSPDLSVRLASSSQPSHALHRSVATSSLVTTRGGAGPGSAFAVQFQTLTPSGIAKI